LEKFGKIGLSNRLVTDRAACISWQLYTAAVSLVEIHPATISMKEKLIGAALSWSSLYLIGAPYPSTRTALRLILQDLVNFRPQKIVG
jgi:predicted nuclease with RNAse H fold